MAGLHSTHQDSSTTTQSSKQPRRTAANEASTKHHQQPKQHISLDDDALPPPHEEEQQHHQKQRIAHPPPIPKAKALVADSNTFSSAFVGGVGVLNDDDETEDEDEEVMRGRETKIIVEPTPKPKIVPPPKVAKVKLTLSATSQSPSTNNIANRTRLTSNPYASTSKSASPTYVRRTSSPIILLPDTSSSADDSDDRPRKRQKGIPKASYPKRAIGVASSELAKGKKVKPLRKKDKTIDPTFTAGSSTRKSTPVLARANTRVISSSVSPKQSNTRSLPTPSRSSLRQVLAASVRDVTESRGTSPALSVQEEKRVYSSDDDSDLSEPGPDSEGDEDDAIERSEEQALREEFEKGNTSRSGVGEDSSDEDDLSDLSEDDNDEGWEVRERERAEDRLRTEADSLHVLHNYNYHREASYADASFEEEEIDLNAMVNDIPETGGRGVVTWSDYDSVESEIEEGEFEVELEELLALSEAVVGPVREDEYELGEMWFEEMSNQGDDESGSAEEDSEVEDDGDSTMIAKQGWGKSSCGSASGGSTDSDDTEGYENYDEENGDTTDSLDSDDHVGLIRFGIEVDDSDSTLDGFSSENGGGEIIYRHAPGTASLADVQPPTSADLASLPQYLFSGFTRDGAAVGMMLNLQELADDPENAINHTVDGLGVGRETAVGILAGVNRSLAKGKGRAREIIEDETEGEGPGGPPAMGSFIPKEKGKGTELSLVIDGSDTVAPSPFSKIKKGKKRPRDFLDAATPSRRSRADSKVSTTSGRSVTDGSLSGEIPDMLSPLIPCETMDLDMEDLLNSSDSSDEDVETMTLELDTTSSGLSDLSRWGRVPIGAFRTSTMPTFSPTQQYLTASAEESVAGYSGRRTSSGTLFVPVVGSTIRGSRTGSSSLSHTLSPYSANDNATNVARMITSPLLRPVRDTTEPSPPKLRNSKLATPKERRARSKSTVGLASQSSPAISTSTRRTSIGTSPIIPFAPHPSTTPANFLSFPRLDLPRVSPLSLE